MLNEKAFIVNSADKVPVLVILAISFLITIIFNIIYNHNKDRHSQIFNKFMKILTYLKYNFFIRF